MENAVVGQLKALKNTLESEIRSETSRLSGLKAEIGVVQKRIDDLTESVANTIRSIQLLERSPSTSARPGGLGKRIPIAWGQGTRLAYGILRSAETPLSVPELARRTLAVAGISEPNDVQLKSMVNVLYRSLKDQVAKGRIIEHTTNPKTFSPTPS
ncbi:hypothetical protein [Mesorhizobium escarrei]|uniref:Uncharacterized protein n=1 Tax=Mesorhizobium escarrei TaxID=666018 RepID=A0ABN8KCF3_9HYPH|nr:hypothetical protein [Mesorhizobium escarrei]CAH2407925.1 hypothetical protein MES5069_620152 [Mesorhizobium escarrei]